MNQDEIGAISGIISTFVILTYTIICYEYPKSYMNGSNPLWLIILKLWGALFVFFISFFLISQTLWYFFKL
jgi:uncharacterized membrane protein